MARRRSENVRGRSVARLTLDPLTEGVMRTRIPVSRQLSRGREAPAHALFCAADFIPEVTKLPPPCLHSSLSTCAVRRDNRRRPEQTAGEAGRSLLLDHETFRCRGG